MTKIWIWIHSAVLETDTEMMQKCLQNVVELAIDACHMVKNDQETMRNPNSSFSKNNQIK